MTDVLERLREPERLHRDRETELLQRSSEDTYLAALGLGRDVEGVVHVAGTKGKGSTCALTATLLQSCGYRLGLYTSPHLHDVRERIQVEGALVDPQLFRRLVAWCHDRLCKVESTDVPFPNYFRFLTLVALRVFEEAAVEGRVLEVGLGGRYDPTNLVRQPWVCGVTSIGMDHMEILGDTIEKIAWDKGGILKQGVTAYTVQQRSGAMQALKECADAVGTTLSETHVGDYENWKEVEAGSQLRGFQLENAALAVTLAREFEKEFWKRRCAAPEAFVRRMENLEGRRLPVEYLRGLSEFRWKGRAQIVRRPYLPKRGGGQDVAENVCFYVDGAHTPESLDACVDWVYSEWKTEEERCLDFVLFQCLQPRDPQLLLRSLHRKLSTYELQPHYVFFAPPLAQNRGLLPVVCQKDQMEWQRQQLLAWCALERNRPRGSTASVQLPSLLGYIADMTTVKRECSGVRAAVFQSLASGLQWFGEVARSQPKFRVRTVVTGSLYFVGDVLKLLEKNATGDHVST